MIVPLAIVCTKRMTGIQKLLALGNVWYSNFAWRPAKLFDAVNRDLTIFLSNKLDNDRKVFTTSYQKWITENRSTLFANIRYTIQINGQPSFWIPKLSHNIENSIMKKILNHETNISKYQDRMNIPIYYRNTGGLYWKVFTLFRPKFFQNGKPMLSSTESSIKVNSVESSLMWSAIYSSNLFWWWYTICSDLRHVTNSELFGIIIPYSLSSDKELKTFAKRYQEDLGNNSKWLIRQQKGTGETKTQSFKVALSKPIIDEIDKVLAKHYGFTEEELDFIINYDIKYRMGDELNNDSD